MKYLLIAALMVLWSCATERQARKYYQKHPEELAYICEREFPRNDSIGMPVITFRPGRSSEGERTDTGHIETKGVSVSGDIVIVPNGDSVWIRNDVSGYPVLSGADFGRYIPINTSALPPSKKSGRARCIPDTIIIETPHYYEKPSAKINAAYIRELEKGNAVLVDKLASKNKWLWRLGIPLAGFVLTTILLIIFKIKS